jgi:serine/threonine protein kinase
VLISVGGTAKLADFGLARILRLDDGGGRGVTGDPEVSPPHNRLWAIGRSLVVRLPSDDLTKPSPLLALTTLLSQVGTAAYMAPECWERTSAATSSEPLPPTSEVGPQADIYSLGITLAELVSGRRPWHGVSSAAIAIRTTLLGARPESQELDDPAR